MSMAPKQGIVWLDKNAIADSVANPSVFIAEWPFKTPALTEILVGL